MKCSNCGEELRANAKSCSRCGAAIEIITAEFIPEGDATGGIIPYKNPKALIAYYLGIASGLPLIGLPFGIAAFVLGIMGLRDRRRNPVIKGSIHAGIGIGCGGVFTIFWTLVIIGIVTALMSKQH
jgi:hypothetical protein